MSRSSTATTAIVTASRVKFAPAKALRMSEPTAGPPVTETSSCSGAASRAAERRSEIIASISSSSASESTVVITRSASPSSAGMGPAASRPEVCASASEISWIPDASASVSSPPSARVTTVKTGW